MLLDERGKTADVGSCFRAVVLKVCMHENGPESAPLATRAPSATANPGCRLVYRVLSVWRIGMRHRRDAASQGQRSGPKCMEERVWHVFDTAIVAPAFSIDCELVSSGHHEATMAAIHRCAEVACRVPVGLFPQCESLDGDTIDPATAELNVHGSSISRLVHFSSLTRLTTLDVRQIRQ